MSPLTGMIFQGIVALALALIARDKGFKPWIWFLACGCIGLFVLLSLPSASADGIDDYEREQRKRKGNVVGSWMSLGFVLCALIIVYLNITHTKF